MDDSAKTHWERVYATKPVETVSWFEATPARSLDMIRATGVGHDAAIVDVGAGASRLVDCLLDEGFRDLTALDISAAALAGSQRRLGDKGTSVQWIVCNVLDFVPERRYALWHDRAALHFLTDANSRLRYRRVLQEALAPSAHVVLASFGPDGPTRCSGLDIRRCDTDGLRELLGPEFRLREEALHRHVTPTATDQQFLYTRWQFVPRPAAVT